MALIFFDGFEAGDALIKWTVTGGTVTASTTNLPYGYGRSVQLNTASGTLTKRFTAVTKVFVGFAYHSGTNNAGDFLSIMGDTGTTTHLTVRWVNSTTIGLYRGGTQIATGTAPEPATTTNLFSYVEVMATISDTVGTAEIRIDGTTVLTFSGDTKNAGTASTIDAVKFANSAGIIVLDDVYIADDSGTAANNFLGAVRVYTLAPTGAGATTQWTPSTGANWAAVDEQPYSATDFISDTVSGDRDTYVMSDLPGTAVSVVGVQACSVSKKSDAGAITFKHTVRSSGTNYASSAITPTTSDATYVDLRPTDPATSAAWTVAAVNAMEAGVEIT